MRFKEFFESSSNEISLRSHYHNEFFGGVELMKNGEIRKNWPGNLILENFQLTSLDGSPEEIKGDFSCGHNALTNFIGGPKIVNGTFLANNNKLTSLQCAPNGVGYNFFCRDNPTLVSFEGAPKFIGRSASFANCGFTSLRNVHKHFKEINGFFSVVRTPVKSHILGLFLIKGVKKFMMESQIDTNVDKDRQKIEKIVNKYIQQGKAGMMECQNELIDAGYEEYAQI